VHVPPTALAAIARALGLLVGDVVLTADEIRGLTDGLLVSRAEPCGRVAFSQWLDSHGDALGRRYANELERHFRAATTG
jgi:NADH dehydrogenase